MALEPLAQVPTQAARTSLANVRLVGTVTLLVSMALGCGESGRAAGREDGGGGGAGASGGGAGASGGGAGVNGGQAGASSGQAGGSGSGGAAGSSSTDCVEVRIDDIARAPRKGFFRDARGLHVGVEHLSTIILRSYSPTGELIHDWDVESVLPAAEYYVQVDFAGNPAGDFAIAVRYPDPVTTFREVILLGNTANVDELSLWPSPFEPSVRRIVELSWDGEAFAVHYVELGGAQPLSLMRLSPAGEMLSEPLEVGPPGSLIAADTQFRTDPESGRSLRITGATVGVGVAGHERDGSWVGGAPLGEFTRFITDPTTESYLGVPPALAVTPESSLLAWNAAYVGLYFQFVNGALEALAPARLLPGAALENASIFRSDEPLAATVRDGRFFLFMKNELGVDRLEVTSEGVVEQINLIQNPGAACLEGSGRCVRNWYVVAGAAQAITYEGELWLGLEENTRGEVYRVLRAEAHCNYPSTWTPEE